MKTCFTDQVQLDPVQLDTLVAITEEGTFEGAARRLHVTPSAVSQRIRALETRAGQVLVRRTTPCSATPAGEPLVRLGRQLRLLTSEATAALAEVPVVELAVAVNADSLATWFRGVLGAVAQREATALRLFVEDERHSHDLLRRGEVLAAVTSDPEPVQGCSVERLGGLAYTPAAHPRLLERHRRGREVDFSTMPMVVYNERDRLQDDVLIARAMPRPPVVHRVPSTADFHEAVRLGLGWGMVLEPGADLVPLPGARPVVVPLFWQHWRLESPALEALTAAVHAAAEALTH